MRRHASGSTRMSSPSPGSGSKARSASRPASPAISSSRSRRPASRSPADRCRTPPSHALRGAAALQHSCCDLKEALMGQYHRAVCIEAEEGLNPYTLGTGAKEGEQGFSRPAAPNAIVALVCARGGNQPADCSQSPVIGRWAGKRVLVQGDYAEDDDIPGWQGPPLSLLYHAMDSREERNELTEHRKKLIAEGMKGIKAPDWSFPIYADISREARDFHEGVCNVRYFEQVQECKDMVPGSPTYGQITDRWTSTHWVNVRPLAREFGDSGVAEYVIDPGYSAKDLDYLKRCGLNPQDVMRPPRS